MTQEQHIEVGFIRQGYKPVRKTRVMACHNADSLWIEVRRPHGKPWSMTPELARELGTLLGAAANVAEYTSTLATILGKMK